MDKIKNKKLISSWKVSALLKVKHRYFARIVQNCCSEIDTRTDCYRGTKFKVYMLTHQDLILCLMNIKKVDFKKIISELMPAQSDMIKNLFAAIKDMDLSEVDADKYVYGAIDGVGRVKIGISSNPTERIKQLNVGNPNELELVYVKRADKPRHQSETELHTEFDNFRIRGEWFSDKVLKMLPMEATNG